jgi:hypothetical protein
LNTNRLEVLLEFSPKNIIKVDAAYLKLYPNPSLINMPSGMVLSKELPTMVGDLISKFKGSD